MTSTPEATATRAAAAFTAYREGDRQRISELVDLLSPILWRAARSQRATASEAEEAVQSAWLKLIDHADSIVDPQAVLAWLLVTVKRDSWRLVRRDSREVTGFADTLDVPLAEPGPEALTLMSEQNAMLWEHVRTLSAQCQHLLGVIAYAARPDYAGVAEALGMPIGSIGPTRGRCLTKLRTSLTNDPRWTE